MSALYSIGSLVSDTKEWFPDIQWQYHAIFGFVLFAVFMLWIIIDKQMQINKVRGSVRIDVRSVKIIPVRGQKGDSAVRFAIGLEIWTDRDIHTDNLILNIVSTRIALIFIPVWKVWELWKTVLRDSPFSKHAVGLRPENGKYRKFIKSDDVQPFRDTIVFKLKGGDKDKALAWSNVFMMEVVLVSGVPNSKYRKYLQWKQLEKETSNPV